MNIWDKYLPSQTARCIIHWSEQKYPYGPPVSNSSPEYRQIISICLRKVHSDHEVDCLIKQVALYGSTTVSETFGDGITEKVSIIPGCSRRLQAGKNTLLRQSSKPWTHEQTHTHTHIKENVATGPTKTSRCESILLIAACGGWSSRKNCPCKCWAKHDLDTPLWPQSCESTMYVWWEVVRIMIVLKHKNND